MTFPTKPCAFGAAREIDLGFSRVWAIRRSFLGELGYELMMPTEFSGHVYDALIAEGAPHGLRHAGMFALGACRLEKGFRHFGHDIGEEDTPFETGLGFAVKLDKGDFVGREILVAQKADGAATKNRTVCGDGTPGRQRRTVRTSCTMSRSGRMMISSAM